MNRVALFLFVLQFIGCIHRRISVDYQGTPVVVFEEPEYDGQKISGRVRIEAKNGPVTFDGRLIENSSIYLNDVRSCGTNKTINGYYIDDYFPAPPNESDMVTVNPEYFYGTTVEYRIFKEAGPDCIDVTFLFFSGVKRPAQAGEAQVRVRFKRTFARAKP